MTLMLFVKIYLKEKHSVVIEIYKNQSLQFSSCHTYLSFPTLSFIPKRDNDMCIEWRNRLEIKHKQCAVNTLIKKAGVFKVCGRCSKNKVNGTLGNMNRKSVTKLPVSFMQYPFVD
jgi:hypothetical protein